MKSQKNDKLTLKDVVRFCVIMAFVFTVKLWFVDIVSVQGMSMEPTLNNANDKIVLQKIDLNFKRGQVVVFDSHIHGLYIKRIIGLPNETVEIKNGDVYVNGNKLTENYIQGKTYSQTEKYVVPENSLFVLGDNRENSADSRIIGFVNFNQVKGVGLYRFNIFTQDFNVLKK